MNTPYKSYISGDDSLSDKPILKKRVEVDNFWFNHNQDRGQGPTPDDLAKWVKDATKKATEKGFVNLRVKSFIEEGTDDALETEHILLLGDKLETQQECNKRLRDIRSKWLREYEEFLRSKKFYESEDGKAQITEALKEK